MSDTPKPVTFTAELVTSHGTPVYHFLRFPKEVVKHFGFKGNLRRVICTLNGAETFNCVLFPKDAHYSIALNKKLRDKLGLTVGDTVEIYLERDESRYGYPMPEEFAEVLRQDPAGNAMFEALSPGNQRIMLKLIDLNKDVDHRITRSLVGLELLKRNGGKFDYHMLDDGMRLAVSARPDVECER
jgi:bifunctional DNA-binding transcriptional regulator/antitoxin component of YhaV-PrlF toxin-antitoxin module